MITSAFTCTGPYAILILLGIKRVENRSAMPVPAAGRCAISCSKSFAKEEYGEFVRWASLNLPPDDFALIPAWDEVRDWPGKIVGACTYAARGRNDLALEGELRASGTLAPTAWDEGYDYWWDLSEVVAFDRPIPCRGNVGIWQLPPALAALKADAKAVIVAHNHPSGDVTPSVQDRHLTAALKKLGEVLGVSVLDHLVIGGDSF